MKPKKRRLFFVAFPFCDKKRPSFAKTGFGQTREAALLQRSVPFPSLSIYVLCCCFAVDGDGGEDGFPFNVPHKFFFDPNKVSKHGLFEPSIFKTEHFTKTGSGQT